MATKFPTTFYHSVSQARLREGVDRGVLKGLSRFHLDPEGKHPGIWMSNELEYVAKNRFGGETSDEVIDVWDAEFMAQITGKEDAEPLVIKKGISPIVLELSGFEEREVLQHPLFMNQFFYMGDIDFEKVKRFLVPVKDPETEVVARELAGSINGRGRAEIEVGTYDPLQFIDYEIKKELSNKKSMKNLLKGMGESKER